MSSSPAKEFRKGEPGIASVFGEQIQYYSERIHLEVLSRFDEKEDEKSDPPK